MGRMKPLLFLVIAVVVALLATFLILTQVKEKARAKEVALGEKVPVAVAVGDLRPGTLLTREMIKEAQFLKETLPGGSFSGANSPVGRVLLFPVKANEPIFEFRLAPTSVKAGGIAAVITPKKRAVAVKVDKVIGVSGFIHPGNHVDILVTIPTGKGSEPVTKTVLENILVLAAGPEVEPKTKEEKASNVEVITLEVAPDEAEKLALSAVEGKLQIVLRSFSDKEDVLTKGITIPALLASYSGGAPVQVVKAAPRRSPSVAKPAPKQVAAAAPEKKAEVEKQDPPKKPVRVVELIKGGKMTEVKFEGEEQR